jgi:hypothetical protein
VKTQKKKGKTRKKAQVFWSGQSGLKIFQREVSSQQHFINNIGALAHGIWMEEYCRIVQAIYELCLE